MLCYTLKETWLILIDHEQLPLIRPSGRSITVLRSDPLPPNAPLPLHQIQTEKVVQETTVVNYNSLEVIIGNNLGYRLFNARSDNKVQKFLAAEVRTKANVTKRTRLGVDIYILPPSNLLCYDAKRSLTIENAGGKSEISEMYSIDYFNNIYNARDVLCENEVGYWYTYKMVDFVCTINTYRVGVSVARAMGYPTADYFTPEIARRLLHKKLYGLIVARNAVVKEQAFTRSVLHIWCQDLRVARLMEEAYSNINPLDYGINVKGIVLLQLTVCDDTQLYRNILL